MGVWQEMIALLDAESMWIDVEGEKGKSHGMIGCALFIRPNSYDHKRSVQEDAVAAENRTQSLRAWGFIIRCFDSTSDFSAPPAAQYGPRGGILCRRSYRTSSNTQKGYGQSDGPGTFRKYTYNYANPRELEARPQEGRGSSTAEEEQ